MGSKRLLYADVWRLLPSLGRDRAKTVLELLRRTDAAFQGRIRRTDDLRGAPLEFANKDTAMVYLTAVAAEMGNDPPGRAILDAFIEEAPWTGSPSATEDGVSEAVDSLPVESEEKTSSSALVVVEGELQKAAAVAGPKAGKNARPTEDKKPEGVAVEVEPEQKGSPDMLASMLSGPAKWWIFGAGLLVTALAVVFKKPPPQRTSTRMGEEAGPALPLPKGVPLTTDLTRDIIRRLEGK